MRVVLRVGLATVAAFLASLWLLPAACNDIGGVPAWERCFSFFGTPTVFAGLGGVIPVVAVGVLVWWLLGRTALGSDDRWNAD